MYKVLETLPEVVKKRIENRSIHHDASLNSAGVPRMGLVHNSEGPPGNAHPIVRLHPETNRPLLYLGRRPGAFIVDMERDESDDLIDLLWRHSYEAEYYYRHRWQRGDLLMWDNRCTMHRRDAFDPASRRIMHRTTLAGEAPIPA
jgi:taurine dioxygenase